VSHLLPSAPRVLAGSSSAVGQSAGPGEQNGLPGSAGGNGNHLLAGHNGVSNYVPSPRSGAAQSIGSAAAEGSAGFGRAGGTEGGCCSTQKCRIVFAASKSLLQPVEGSGREMVRPESEKSSFLSQHGSGTPADHPRGPDGDCITKCAHSETRSG